MGTYQQGNAVLLPDRNLRRAFRHFRVAVILSCFALLTGTDLPVVTNSQATAGAQPSGAACTSFCLRNGEHAVFGTNFDNAFPDGLLFVNKRGVKKDRLGVRNHGQIRPVDGAIWQRHVQSCRTSHGLGRHERSRVGHQYNVPEGDSSASV